MTTETTRRPLSPTRSFAAPRRVAVAAAALLACLAASASLPAGALAASSRDLRGPLVAIPHCTVISQGCSLDPETPDLNPAGCAATVSRRLERQGVRTEVIGPGSVVCGEGSNALIMEGTLTAQCPARAESKPALAQVLSVRLELQLELKDCFSGERLGYGKAERSFEAGRHVLVRDAVEELSHHTSERKVRSLFPDTPIRWMRGDVGGEASLELSTGAIDISGSGINDFLDSVDLDNEDWAGRILGEVAYNPESSQLTRVSIGIEYIGVSVEGDGDVDLLELGRNPANNPAFDPNEPHRVEMNLQVLGLRGSVSQGWDFTKNQRIAVQGAVGYYILGNGLAPATIKIEGLASDVYRLKNASMMLEGLVRYTWRFTPHLAFSAGYGYSYLEYSSPNRVKRSSMFPYDLDFTGASVRIGLAGRF